MEIDQSLASLGLDDKEVRVYKALLEHGIANPATIANSSGVKRSTTYVVLEDLEEKGFAFEVPKENKKRYRPRPPEAIFEKKEERLKEAKEALPKLQALEKEGDTKPHVLFFEGEDGIRDVFDYKLEEMAGKELPNFMCTMDQETVDEFDNFTAYNKKLKELDISERGISPIDPSLPAIQEHRQMDEEFNREVIELPLEKFNSEVSMEIGDGWVKIYDFDNLQALVIENDAITDTWRQIFELLWKNLKEA
jgi:predicted transcriptional regulator